MVASGLTVCDSAEETFGEVALDEGEEDDDRDHGDHDRGHEQVPRHALLTDEVIETTRHDLLIKA